MGCVTSNRSFAPFTIRSCTKTISTSSMTPFYCWRPLLTFARYPFRILSSLAEIVLYPLLVHHRLHKDALCFFLAKGWGRLDPFILGIFVALHWKCNHCTAPFVVIEVFNVARRRPRTCSAQFEKGVLLSDSIRINRAISKLNV